MMPDLRDTTAHLMPVRDPQSSKTLETAKTPSPTVPDRHKDLKDPKVPLTPGGDPGGELTGMYVPRVGPHLEDGNLRESHHNSHIHGYLHACLGE